jgi:hypothetical protein
MMPSFAMKVERGGWLVGLLVVKTVELLFPFQNAVILCLSWRSSAN